MSIFHEVLKRYWGYDDFRPLQEEIIASVYNGTDTLGLMPTGGGKSITFQVPAMAMEGLCLVVTPLVALMKDQVENLKHKGIKAASIHAAMSHSEIIDTFDNCYFGGYKFLYVSPERLSTPLFLKRIEALNVSMIVVDESHCISQWGYDFRPSYLKIASVRTIFPHAPVLALTATATPEVVDDIQERLAFKKKNVFQKSFERSNLAYIVRYCEDKHSQLLRILGAVQGTSVVYVRSRARTKEIAEFLIKNNITADYFHAGLSNEEKDAKQLAWKSGTCRVIVATNAFGMGIDKAEVRTVVHIDLPDSIEAYFQEAGRAGRDGQKAYAVLLYNNADAAKLKKRIADNFPPKDFIVKVYNKLGDYFELGVGYGLEKVYAFSLIEFCKQCALPINPTYSALKILEMSGYLELTEELDNPSKLQFTITHRELYKLKTNDTTEHLIQLILRSYTGVFSDHIHINEGQLAKHLNTTREEVYNQLINLSKKGIIHYIPFKKTPFIIYTIERQDGDAIRIPPSAYEERKERFEGKIMAMLHYAQSTDECRSNILLNYFGEKQTKTCQQCDVCLQHKSRNPESATRERVKRAIAQILQQKPMRADLLVKRLSGNHATNLSIIQSLIDSGWLIANKQQELSLKQGK